MHLRVPLDKFSLDVECTTSQRVVGLFGPSGSGKTTWLETIAGLRRDARGYLSCGDAVWLDSDAGINLPPEDRGIGYVPQDHLLFPHHDVRRNLEIGSRRALREGHNFTAAFADVVRVLELEPLLQRTIGGLSGGERQRVALGRALCSGPRLLMMDEPLASLDIQLRHRILPFLLRVRDSFKIPIVIVSHNLIELQALCDEVIALRDGSIIAQGEPTEVFTRADIYTSAAAEGFENILPAVVIAHAEHTTTLRVGDDDDGQEVSVLRAELPADDHVMIGIPANDILVATHRVRGLSARNCLAATIKTIETVDHKRRSPECANRPAGEAHRLDFGQCLEPQPTGLVENARLFAVVAVHLHRQREIGGAVDVVAHVDPLRRRQAADHKSTRHQQDNRNRHLYDNQRVAQLHPSLAATRTLTGVFERRNQVWLRGSQCRNQTEHHAGDPRRDHREQEHTPVRRHREGDVYG